VKRRTGRERGRRAIPVAAALALATGCGSLPQVPVRGVFLGHRLETTVDSEIARYFVERYLPGRRGDSALDARIGAICRGHRGVPGRDELGRISDSASPDFAALFLALRLREQEANRELQERFAANVARLRAGLKAGHPDPVAGSGRYRVLLVPGWDYRSNGKVTGSDLARPRKLLDRLGMDNRLVEIDPVGSVERNARDVADAAVRAQDSGKSLIVVGPSSAGPAIHLALARTIPAERRGSIKAWVNLGGVLQGSPLIEYLQAWPRSWLFEAVIRFKGWKKEDVLSMSATRSRARFRTLSLPPDLFIVNYMGVAMSGELSRFSRDKYPVLRKSGPNDGLTLLPDIIAPGSRTLLALGSDHFFAEDPEIDLKTVAMAHTLIQILEERRITGTSPHLP
jgi:hypothetical protein